jgi:hypothetical protein
LAETKAPKWTKWMVACIALLLALMLLGAWALRPRTLRPHVTHASEITIRWADLTIRETRQSQIGQFCEAAVRAEHQVDYAPKCIGDRPQERCSIVFTDTDGIAFEVWLPVDDCCDYIYAPSLEKTYLDAGGLIELARARAKREGGTGEWP